jgi:hypothetical protein
VFVCSGEYWTIGDKTATFLLKHILGLSYIQRLLQNPGAEIHALDLAGGAEIAPSVANTQAISLLREREDVTVVRGLGDSGALLDEKAKADYKRRLLELQEELDELLQRGTHERAAKVESEIDFIKREVVRAVGLGGRDRRAGSAAERARLNVTRAIKTAIEKIAERNSALGDLLDRSIRTGLFCAYLPEPGKNPDWSFSPTPAAPPAAGSNRPLLGQSEAFFSQLLVGRAAFVGREAASDTLDGVLELARTGKGRVVMISGPPGVGKSRMAAEFCMRAVRSGAIAVAGSCNILAYHQRVLSTGARPRRARGSFGFHTAVFATGLMICRNGQIANKSKPERPPKLHKSRADLVAEFSAVT